MINIQQMGLLLQQQESATLDFKRQLYDFDSNGDVQTAHLVKDVCAMVNTIRRGPAYIVFGVEAEPGLPVKLVGLQKFVDEGILQDKVKAKIFPSAQFSYYTLQMGDVILGILEFPIRYYVSPVMPTVKMKGVSPNVVYFRQGSTNSVASPQEIIGISDWLRALPKLDSLIERRMELDNILQLLQDHTALLSPIISKLYGVAKRFHLEPLIEMCGIELAATEDLVKQKRSSLLFRTQTVFFDVGGNVEINLDQFNSSEIRTAFKTDEHMIETKLFMAKPLIDLEVMLADFAKRDNKRVMTFTTTTHALLPEFQGSNSKVVVYFFHEDVKQLVMAIRKRAIELVIEAANG